MPKKKKKPPCAAGYGRTKAGKCRKGPKRRSSKKKASRNKLGKPTPLFSDVVQFARGARRFPCGSDQRSLFMSRALEYLKKAQTFNDNNALNDQTKLRRAAAISRAGEQVLRVNKECLKRTKNQLILSYVRNRMSQAGLNPPSSVASGSPTGQNVPRSSANSKTTSGAQSTKKKKSDIPDFMIPMIEKLESESKRPEPLDMPTDDDPRVLDMPDDDEVITYQVAKPPRKRAPRKKKTTETKSLPAPAVQTEWEEFKAALGKVAKQGEAIARKMAKQSA